MRAAILAAAENASIRRVVSRHGMALGARRFVAGETLAEFLAVARAVNARGFAVAAGILGEDVRTAEEAIGAAQQYCTLLRTIATEGLDANAAFKLTHVGLEIDPELAFQNALRIVRTAHETNNFARIDMEQSAHIDATLAIFRRLREQYDCVGCVLQSYLYRSPADLRTLLPLAPNIRIVKGAYLEAPAVAFPKKRDVDAQYRRLVQEALCAQAYTAIATHDRAIIDDVRRFAQERALPARGRFEFQMLYGIAGAAADELVRAGYRVRLAVPFGDSWFPYLMRRLAERPANLAFMLKSLLSRG